MYMYVQSLCHTSTYNNSCGKLTTHKVYCINNVGIYHLLLTLGVHAQQGLQ